MPQLNRQTTIRSMSTQLNTTNGNSEENQIMKDRRTKHLAATIEDTADEESSENSDSNNTAVSDDNTENSDLTASVTDTADEQRITAGRDGNNEDSDSGAEQLRIIKKDRQTPNFAPSYLSEDVDDNTDAVIGETPNRYGPSQKATSPANKRPKKHGRRTLTDKRSSRQTVTKPSQRHNQKEGLTNRKRRLDRDNDGSDNDGRKKPKLLLNPNHLYTSD